MNRSASWEQSFGGALSTSASATAEASMSRVDLRRHAVRWMGGFPIRPDRRDTFDYNADLRGTVRLFGRSFTLGSATADLIVEQGIYSRNPIDYKTGAPSRNRTFGHLKARAFGTTIVDETRYGSSQILSFSDSVYGFTASRTFWVGPVPVAVSGRLGGGCSISGSLILDAGYSNPRLGIAGSASGYAQASASAGVGITGASAGVSATLRILRTTATLEASASRSAVNGRLGISLTPLAVSLYIYVEALWWEYSRRVAGWSTGTWSRFYDLF